VKNCREYGTNPYRALIIHGGPGAIGSCAGMCMELSGKTGVLEHLQSKNSIKELIEEIRELIEVYNLKRCTYWTSVVMNRGKNIMPKINFLKFLKWKLLNNIGICGGGLETTGLME